ncbi:MAG: biopolymer transporter ExbD [Desulfovibrio sp.]|jgi:biopolymer transport protein ExbD|nr:biopolymer transporter ExbD [Desulfovibrio sp.]
MTDGFGFDAGLGDGPDLTPLIDVIFLLLIFFIMATTFMKPAVDVLLPSADSGTMASEERQTVVTIDSQGSVYLEGERVSLEELGAALAGLPERPLNFMVDRQAPFQAFMGALDQARLQGREDFTITTEPDHDGHP